MDTTMEEPVSLAEASPPTEESAAELAQFAEPLPQEAAPLSRKFEEIVELMRRINRLLEDLSVDRRAEVSSKQWETWEEFKSSPARNIKPAKFWQNSIFARTYFVDKDLDESYHNVVKHGSLFFSHLNAISDKVQCRGDGLSGHKRHAEDSSSEVTIIRDLHQSTESGIAAGDASNQQSSREQASRTADRSKDIEIIKQSFTNLIKAKIEFDTQFLNFNGVLNKSAFPEDSQVLSEISGTASKLLAQTTSAIESRKASPAGSKSKRLRRKAAYVNTGGKSHKRLRRSARIASEEDSGEVQVIRSLRRRDAE